jgi:uncharacterized membrane protein HdeD (DUF308 family)
LILPISTFVADLFPAGERDEHVWGEPVADPILRDDPADVLARVGRHWGWVFAFGALTAIAGVAVLVWPGPTLQVIAVLFGIQLVVYGIFRFVAAFAVDDEGTGTRVLYALLGVLSFIVGIYAIRHVLVTLASLALLLGIFWIVQGSVELFTAISNRGLPSRGWTIFVGIISVLAGIVVLVYPSISLVTLAIVLGIWLIFFGAMEIYFAFRLRSVGSVAGRLAGAH